MKKRERVLQAIMLLIISILVLIPFSLANDIYYYDSLILNQTITNELTIIPDTSTYDVNYITIELELIPQESPRQTVLNQEFIPKPKEITDNNILFHWENPQELRVDISSSANIQTNATRIHVKEKIPFPIKQVPVSIQKYLDTTEYIDSNDEIEHTAFLLANGVDDLYELEFAFAQWVNKEISYNLSTITSDVNQPSSWVYENRYGVCDEITNLFISFNRAVGVPARFVSGIAYSDLIETKWGNHGWAEIYFPDVGWVPFDVTYEQYGFVDATHIELAKRVDGSYPSVKYATRGQGFDFKPSELTFKTDIVRTGDSIKPLTSVSITPQEPLIGFESYNLVSATIKNNQDFYVVEEINLAKTEGLTFFDELQQRVLLKPFEEKKLFWLVKVDDSLTNDFVYTFPLTAFTSQKENVETFFKVEQSGEKYSKLYMEQFLVLSEEKEVVINCEGKNNILFGNTLLITCSFSKDEFPISLCLEDNCQVLQSKSDAITITPDTSMLGVHTVVVESADKEYQTFVTYKVSDTPHLEITQAHMPNVVHFDEQTRIKLFVNKTSLSHPTDVHILLTNGLIAESWDFTTFSESKAFEVIIEGQTLALGKNTFVASAMFTDNEGKIITQEEVIYTTMVADTFGQKIIGCINRFSIQVNKIGTALGEKLVGKTRPQLQRFLVMLITFIILSLCIATMIFVIKSVKRIIVRK
ncbi:transglutaminase domain-containing protein [Candidatus Woesearchaeota archaeon]|nr:transglutaminase domain-containing protein [Candidatus Woesearchaeota archaeon]